MPIDHNSFPHIVARIATLAPLELRATSRSWRTFVDRECCTHWRLEQGQNYRLSAYVYAPRASPRRWLSLEDIDCGITTEYLPPWSSDNPDDRPADPRPGEPRPFPILFGGPWGQNPPTPSTQLTRPSSYSTEVVPSFKATAEAAYPTQLVRSLDVVGSLNVDTRWDDVFKRVEIIRFFPTMHSRLAPMFLSPPLVIAFYSYRGPVMWSPLPPGVQHLIASIGPVWSGPPADHPRPNSVPVSNALPFVRPLPTTLNHLTIVYRDLESWTYVSSSIKGNWNFIGSGIAHRLGQRDLKITIVGDLSIILPLAQTFPRVAEGKAAQYRDALIRISRGQRVETHYPVPSSTVEAEALLRILPPPAPYDESLLRFVSVEEWREEVGEHVFALSTDATYPVTP